MLIAKHGMELFDKSYAWNLPLRSVGVRAINLKGENAAVQQDLFGESGEVEKIEQIDSSLFTLRDRFGKGSIKRGRTIS